MTGQGRVWRIGDDGAPREAFRVQPMVSDVNVDATGVGGIGRDPRSAPPATVTITPAGRQAANTLGSQHIVANGLAFDRDGSLFIGDTARGAIWRVDVDRRGRVRSPIGCDTDVRLEHALPQQRVRAAPGARGRRRHRARPARATCSPPSTSATRWWWRRRRDGVVELYRNPVSSARLRNEGPLEFPTSPAIVGRKLCLAHSDGSRRDNFPNSGGEVGPGNPAGRREALVPRPQAAREGLPLPVR